MRKKIVSLRELSEITRQLKAEGKTVAQCHGCFDLMHPGHIKHFESASKAADILVVTVTPDRFVNKGPGRPVFGEALRMESIAALECVDYVALNEWPTAIETIRLVRPDFYVKGPDYRDRDQDLTGNIRKEEDAVAEVGGQFYITDDVTFSSSKIINAHFNPLPGNVQEYLSGIRDKFPVDHILSKLNSLSDLRVLVIGDTIVDEYHYCVPLGAASKSPTLSVKFIRAESFPGGSLAIANHVNEFAGKVHLLSVLGKQNDQRDVILPKLRPGIESHFFSRDDSPTVTKRRYISEFLNTKMFSVNFMNDKFLEPALEEEIIQKLESLLPEIDIVLVADFGHGMITPRIREHLAASGKFLSINAQTNSANFGYNYITRYNKVGYVSIDEKELRLPFGDQHGSVSDLVRKLNSQVHADSILITLGAKGAVYHKDNHDYKAPPLASTVVDSVGAGDAVLSITTLCAYKEFEPELIPFIGNVVGSVAVNILCNERPVNKAEITKLISHLLK
jgi:rfaE bifunctional protein kinase chain/domain/rfaE bifunctional protein nucleotidyltransferase chain/domain